MLVWVLSSLATAVLFTGGPAPNTDPIRVAEVDLMELHHFVDPEGREVFRQVIFYDWRPTTRRFEIRGWRLIKDPSELPRPLFRPGGHLAVWRDDDVRHEVRSAKFRETWSDRDPERLARRRLPENRRRPLFD